MNLVRAYQKDEALLRDVFEHSGDARHVHIWWLGQSGFLIGWNDVYLLIDPYLSDSLTRKYADTDKPHTRMSERVIDPAMLNFISVVTSSHNHTDHLDAETLKPLLKANPGIRMVIPEANRQFVSERIGMPLDFPIGMNDGWEKEIEGIRITGVPAAHNELDRDEAGHCKYMGYVIEIGGVTIYHSGDTLRFDGMEDILAPMHIDLALLPINGNDPARKVSGNLNTEEAAALAADISAKLTVPCHYDMFTFNTADPMLFEKAAMKKGIAYRILRLGERLSISVR